MDTSSKYLGLRLDKIPTRAIYIKTKQKSLGLRLHKLRQLLRSKMPLNNKKLIHRHLIPPTMTHGILFSSTTKKL